MKYGEPESYRYFLDRDLPDIDKWQLLRLRGKDALSLKAQLKLEWIIFYQTIGKENAIKTAKHFGINPKTLHKWKKRFNEKDLIMLEERSRAPEKTRTRDISPLQRLRIRELRKKHLRWGKLKLRKRYAEIYGEYVSSWKFQVVIEEEHLYFDKAKHNKQEKRLKQAQKQPKKRIHTLLKESKANFLWHVDTVIFTLSQGGYRYLLTAIDDYSKLSYARLYTTHSSKQAADFLRRLHYLTEGEIINLHYDNGSEFQKDFEKACHELSLPQWYSRVRTPKDNAVLERFNRTIQEEFVEMIDVGLEDIRELNQRLTEWLIEYNSIRPHQALDYQTPLGYIDSQVLPMSSSRTGY
ncbi:integrase core domain-containing protein [Patescibacteria group bacterium]|nr:integrase core domain-containing protein [Patescibacteria group bacterium]